MFQKDQALSNKSFTSKEKTILGVRTETIERVKSIDV